MNNAEKMLNSAYQAMKELFKISSNDKVLIITDIHCKTIAKAFSEVCYKIGSEVETFEIKEQSRPLKGTTRRTYKIVIGKEYCTKCFQSIF